MPFEVRDLVLMESIQNREASSSNEDQVVSKIKKISSSKFNRMQAKFSMIIFIQEQKND